MNVSPIDQRMMRDREARPLGSGALALDDPFAERLYGFLSERQRRAVESSDECALGTTVGSVRSRNEDVCLVLKVAFSRNPDRNFEIAIVCDGMGGMLDGRQAALIAASTFTKHLLLASPFEHPIARLRQALELAQQGVLKALQGDGGTTLSCVFRDTYGQAWLAHVGDSRIYGVRDDGALEQLSRDDTLGAALNRSAESRGDFNRLIQFVGIEGDLDPQLAMINAHEFRHYLLTSDGAHSAPNDVLSTVSHHAKSPTDFVRKLLGLADALGGLDNASAVVVPAFTGRPEPSGRGDYAFATLLCPSGEHHIWIASNPTMESQTYLRRQQSLEESPAPSAQKPPKKKRSPKSKKRSVDISGDELPLGTPPIARVDFSDDGESTP